MKRRATWVFGASCLLGAAVPVSAQTEDSAESTLTGEWGGARLRWEKRGVSVWANYTGEALRNFSGGFETGNTYEGVAEAGVALDMQPLAGWKGVSFYFSGMRVHGDDPSAELLGDFNYASNIVCENTTRLFHAWAAWKGERFAVKAGLLSVDDAFMVSETGQLFINSGFGPLPSVSGNMRAPIWPISGLGVWAEWDVAKGWRLQSGIYDGDGGDEFTNRHGTSVQLNTDEGAMVMIEAAKTFLAAGREGVFTTGVWMHNGHFQNYRTEETDHGNEGVYVMIDQSLSPAEATGCEWHVFARAGRPLGEERNVVRFHADAGISVKGLFAGRANDVAGLGVCMTGFGRDYLAAREFAESPATRRETVVEATYTIALGRGLTVQPDLQYLVGPHESGRDAFAGILRVSAEF